MPAARESASPASTRFVRLAPDATGVTFRSNLLPKHPNARLYHSGFSAGGVAIGDVDGDRKPDLFLVGNAGQNRLYRQKGALEFVDATAAAGVAGGERWGAGAAFADVDNDGDLDLFVCNYEAPNQLFLNDGRGRFREGAKAAGVDLVAASFMPSFCDYDRDGDLDLFVLTYRAYRAGGRAAHIVDFAGDGTFEVRPEMRRYYQATRIGTDKNGKPLVKVKTFGHQDHLYRNNGDGTFTDVSATAGITAFGMGLSATWWDYDEDGWPDLYVCNDFDDPDHLYRNQGDGTFVDRIADVAPHTTWFSMGSDAADLNNDGRIDFVAADMSATTHFKQKTTMGAMNAKKILAVAGPPPQLMRNAVLLNTGTDRMIEAAYLMGIADTDWTWCVRLADFDNDGRVDCFFTNGMTRSFNDSDVPFHESMLRGRTQFDVFAKMPTRKEQNLAFRNTGALGFTDVSKAWGLGHLGVSFAAASGDLDGDGDLDLVVGNLDEPTSIYRNDAGEKGLVVHLRGRKNNRFGFGARVELTTERGRQVRVLQPSTGLLSSNEPVVHFGLGGAKEIRSLTVRWPDGREQQVGDAAGPSVTVVEAEGAASVSRAVPRPLFTPGSQFREAVHKENDFDDFALQPLLPNKLSALGPGVAWGDVDGDGDDDAFVGGAAGQPGMLFRNEGAGNFAPIDCQAFRTDAGREDMGAVFLDVEGDGDLDLFVGSGGMHYPSIPLLADRIYLNDGSGGFQRAGYGVVPRGTHHSSAVAAADLDGDGDLDLFVGARGMRGRYPLAPQSRLLRNEGGRFSDVTGELAPELARVGLVTGVCWSDADGDGAMDLLVTTEWGAVRFFRNDGGKLVDRTAASGMGAHTGWWNGIAAADLDGDGDIDYVTTNFGLNTKYHASAAKPALLYYGDFDGSGKYRLVEAEFEGQHLFPIRGKSCSTQAMPFLGEKFKTYKSFALAELSDLYTDKCLEKAHRFAATTLASGVWINDGAGRFVFRPLPPLAQVAPGFGVVVFDADGDPHPDLFLAQNFYGPQVETGPMDGGLGLLLRGRGDGTFESVWPDRSGVVLAVDATAATTVDLNGDGRLDLLVGVNNGPCRSLLAGTARPPSVTVRLSGPKGNPSAVGARVTVELADGSQQTAEVQAGGGYLSQSSPTLAFGTRGQELRKLRVRWPGGVTKDYRGKPGQRAFRLASPK